VSKAIGHTGCSQVLLDLTKQEELVKKHKLNKKKQKG
jgi:hypothetical protein